METGGLEQLFQAIDRAEAQGKPDIVFTFLPEQMVWIHMRSILDNPEQSARVGPTLLQGVGVSFLHLIDRIALVEILLQALRPANDSLVYEAAQRIVLSYAQEFDPHTAKHLHTLFINGYTETVQDGDQYIAMRALEGAIMFPLYRGENRLLLKAVALILTDFPLPSDDPHDAALLSVKALKLLGWCYDRRPNEDIADLIREMVVHRNFALANEARFNLGVIRLYDAFRAIDEISFRHALLEAHELFETAFALEEGRSDAELFATVAKCYLALSTTALPSNVSALVREAKSILTERILSFGGAMQEMREHVEADMVRLVLAFELWIAQLATIHQQPNLGLPMRELAYIYASVRTLKATEGFTGSASGAGTTWVMLPQIRGRFVQVQEITAKLSCMLRDSSWRTSASQTEIEFYELVLQEVQSNPDPKAYAASRLNRIRVAAERDAPELAQRIATLQQGNLSVEDILLELAQQSLEEQQAAKHSLIGACGPAQEIYDAISSQLLENLKWDSAQPAWKYFSSILRIITRYFVSMYQTTKEEAKPINVNFLFAKEIGGMGKDAREGDLEAHFYSTVTMASPMFPDWQAGIERQSISGVPGRTDLLFRFPHNIVYVVEVKCEDVNVGRDNIHAKYLAQAQSYAAGTQQISILFVLDTTTKKAGVPLLNVRDYCYIDQHKTLNANYKDYVVVFIFPANSYRPSDHTNKKKRSST